MAWTWAWLVATMTVRTGEPQETMSTASLAMTALTGKTGLTQCEGAQEMTRSEVGPAMMNVRGGDGTNDDCYGGAGDDTFSGCDGNVHDD